MAMDYPKTSSGDATNEYGDGTLRKAPAMSGGGSSSSGPTGSSRSYPKGSKISTDASKLNPRNQACTDIYVGGV